MSCCIGDCVWTFGCLLGVAELDGPRSPRERIRWDFLADGKHERVAGGFSAYAGGLVNLGAKEGIYTSEPYIC